LTKSFEKLKVIELFPGLVMASPTPTNHFREQVTMSPTCGNAHFQERVTPSLAPEMDAISRSR
jgi:hypothetical protein